MSGNIKYIGEKTPEVKPLPTSGYISQSNSDGKDAALNKFILSFTQEGSFGSKNTKTEMEREFPQLSNILAEQGADAVKQKLQVKQEPANNKDCSVFTVSKTPDVQIEQSQHIISAPATSEEETQSNLNNITGVLEHLQNDSKESNSSKADETSSLKELVQLLEVQVQSLKQAQRSGVITQTVPEITTSNKLTTAANELAFSLIGTQREFINDKVPEFLEEVLDRLKDFEEKNVGLESQIKDLKSQRKDVRALEAQILALNTTIESLNQVIGFDKKLFQSPTNKLLDESHKATEGLLEESIANEEARKAMDQSSGDKAEQSPKLKKKNAQKVSNSVVSNIDETELEKSTTRIKSEILRLAEIYYSKDKETKDKNMKIITARLNQSRNNTINTLSLILEGAKKNKFIEGGSNASRRKRLKSRKPHSYKNKNKTKTRRYRKRSFTRRRK
jgi:hypothetical protein